MTRCLRCSMTMEPEGSGREGADPSLAFHADPMVCILGLRQTAMRRRVILGRVEWTGRQFAGDEPGVRRCPECGQQHPRHGGSCSLHVELEATGP